MQSNIAAIGWKYGYVHCFSELIKPEKLNLFCTTWAARATGLVEALKSLTSPSSSPLLYRFPGFLVVEGKGMAIKPIGPNYVEHGLIITLHPHIAARPLPCYYTSREQNPAGKNRISACTWMCWRSPYGSSRTDEALMHCSTAHVVSPNRILPTLDNLKCFLNAELIISTSLTLWAAYRKLSDVSCAENDMTFLAGNIWMRLKTLSLNLATLEEGASLLSFKSCKWSATSMKFESVK